MHRHPHPSGFLALVLGGAYVEAGDSGRHRVTPGDVIVHRSYEQHVNRFSSRGAEVLVLPLLDEHSGAVLGRIGDPDFIARTAERSLGEAAEALVSLMVQRPVLTCDWPDMLARDLLEDPGLSLSRWADSHGLHPGSLSRGFSQQFEIGPATFRAVARAHRAVRLIVSGGTRLSAIALDQGYADQAHMSRAVKRLTGRAPRVLRKLSGCSGARGD